MTFTWLGNDVWSGFTKKPSLIAPFLYAAPPIFRRCILHCFLDRDSRFKRHEYYLLVNLLTVTCLWSECSWGAAFPTWECQFGNFQKMLSQSRTCIYSHLTALQNVMFAWKKWQTITSAETSPRMLSISTTELSVHLASRNIDIEFI